MNCHGNSRKVPSPYIATCSTTKNEIKTDSLKTGSRLFKFNALAENAKKNSNSLGVNK